jgi:predicted ArsR family transcriptional regulator
MIYMTLAPFSKKESPLWRILEQMQRHGSATIRELEELLGITTTAVRQHLNGLQLEGYIERRTVHAGVGRPHHAYFLTPRAQDLFACHCDDLALTLLEEVLAIEGQERAVMLLDRVGTRLASKYASLVKSNVLEERVQQMARALNHNGVLADSHIQDEDVIILRTYNCPYHELAQGHREICEMDKAMISKVVGAEVELSNCMMDGHAGCVFQVSGAKLAQAALATTKNGF